MLQFSAAALVWLALVVVFAVLEAATVGLVSIWFAAGAVAALIASAFTASVSVQTILFIGVSLAALALTRPLIRKHRLDKPTPTNADLNVGRTATVIVRITPEVPGRAKLDGVDWAARSADTLEPGALCRVEALDGATLTVCAICAPCVCAAAGSSATSEE